MVNITPEEVMAQRRAAQQGPEFSEFDLKVIGGGVRIDIPMDSRVCDIPWLYLVRARQRR